MSHQHSSSAVAACREKEDRLLKSIQDRCDAFFDSFDDATIYEMFEEAKTLVREASSSSTKIDATSKMLRLPSSKQPCGRKELILLLSELKRRKAAFQLSSAQTLELETVFKIAFYVGCRPDLLVQSGQDNDALRCSDINIHQIARYKYYIEVNLSKIKGFRTSNHGSYEIERFGVNSVFKVKNVVFDLSVSIIPFCIERGILYDNHSKQIVTNILDFCGSSATNFSIRGKDGKDELLFRQSNDGYPTPSGQETLTENIIVEQILDVARYVGLESGTIPIIRHDVGIETQALNGGDTGRLLLGHEQFNSSRVTVATKQSSNSSAKDKASATPLIADITQGKSSNLKRKAKGEGEKKRKRGPYSPRANLKIFDDRNEIEDDTIVQIVGSSAQEACLHAMLLNGLPILSGHRYKIFENYYNANGYCTSCSHSAGQSTLAKLRHLLGHQAEDYNRIVSDNIKTEV